MSDEPERPRVITAPLGASPAPAPEPAAPLTAKLEPPAPMPEQAVLTTVRIEPAPANARPATQMSASAVPSTLESPQDPAADAVTAIVATLSNSTAVVDEIHGAALVRGEAARSDASVPPELEATAPASHRGGPATMMSPAVAAPLPGASTPPLAPEQAVVDVGAPAHAFVPYGGGASPGVGGPQGMMHHGPAGPAGRSTSTTFFVLVIGGGVAAVAILAIAVVGFFLLTSRRAAELGDPRGSRQPGAAVAPGSPEAPRLPARMGGTRARVSVTSSGLLDPLAVRAVIDAALPHLDACFAATELDPPNHESASYEVDVTPSGEVRRAEPAGSGARSAKLDACMVQSLRSVRMPRSFKPSVVKLTFVAPIDAR